MPKFPSTPQARIDHLIGKRVTYKGKKELPQDRIDAACQGYVFDMYFDVPQYDDVRYEGPTKCCSECGKELETEYGDPDSPDSDK